ncbi:MAG TPA: VOC family protein, partial [Bacillota bacterium]|nr:VOC family protein [Bacillota bacterium]
EIAGLKIQREMKGPFSIVFLANAEDETCIELIESKDICYSGEGISIGFHVPDVEKYHEELQKKGFDPTPIEAPAPNVKFFFVKDPGGVMIQFI